MCNWVKRYIENKLDLDAQTKYILKLYNNGGALEKEPSSLVKRGDYVKWNDEKEWWEITSTGVQEAIHLRQTIESQSLTVFSAVAAIIAAGISVAFSTSIIQTGVGVIFFLMACYLIIITRGRTKFLHGDWEFKELTNNQNINKMNNNTCQRDRSDQNIGEDIGEDNSERNVEKDLN